MKTELVTFKGNREGLLILCEQEAPWGHVFERLKARLQGKEGAFLDGARVVIDTGNRLLTAEQASALWSLFEEQGLRIKAIRSKDEKESSEKNGGEGGALKEKGLVDSDYVNKLPTLFIKRSLRSGQSITYAGNVVIMGDVNPGAEVIAKGFIMVLGALRGIAHAGIFGDEEALIMALRLQASQLRIANKISRAPEEEGKEPEVAHVADGIIVCEPLEWIRKGI